MTLLLGILLEGFCVGEKHRVEKDTILSFSPVSQAREYFLGFIGQLSKQSGISMGTKKANRAALWQATSKRMQ